MAEIMQQPLRGHSISWLYRLLIVWILFALQVMGNQQFSQFVLT